MVQWRPALDCDNYIVTFTNLNMSNAQTENSTDTSLTLLNLSPGNLYYIEVQAVYETGIGEASEPAYQLLSKCGFD